MRHETAILWTKKPNPEIPVIIFFAYFFSSTTKTQKIAETHILECFSKPKKDNFQNLNLKHWK